jgi:anti-sigma regulatory factor (Ser/Thr protein kinase)
MPTVRLSFSPAAAHVRTARLVGVAVARRAGVATELFDEIRLAIGEACSRAVALHREHNIPDLVEVALVDGDGDRFTVRVTDRAPIDAGLGPVLPDPPDPVALLDDPTVELPVGDPSGEEAVAVGMRLALLIGIVDDLSVRPAEAGPGTEVLMSWPTKQGRNGSGNARTGGQR